MAASNVRLRYLILGLLTRKPMSGYDIKRFLKGLDWLIGSPSFGGLYPALRALLQDSLIGEDDIPHQSRRLRKIYRITDAGKQAFQEWLNQPIAPDASLKSFVMRLVLASNFPRAGLIAHLQQRRSQVAAHRATLLQIAEVPGEGTELEERLVLDYGLTLARAELAWLDSTLDRLSQPLPMEVVQDDSALLKV
jgi:PadR family transcriptional regulator AphA